MISIDHICIKLPHTMQSQADLFATHLADALSLMKIANNTQLSSVSLPSIKMQKGQDIKELAGQVARQIHQAVDGEKHD